MAAVAEAPPGATRATGGRPRRRRWGRWIMLVALAVVLGYGVYVVGSVVAASHVDQRDHTEAIVVLGAAQWDGKPSPVLKERLDHALGLYRSGVAPEIVLTGSKQPSDRFTEAYSGFRYLLGKGVPEKHMSLITDGRSTYESLAATNRVLSQRGVDRVTLVSDGYHNRRLQGIAGELGLDATVSPSTTGGPVGQLARESGLVAVGEILGYRRVNRFS